MRNLLTTPDRDRLVATLANGLGRDIELQGRPVFALAAGEEEALFDLRQNARAAELLLQPVIRDAMPDQADGLLDFLLAMGAARVPCRRAARPLLELRRDDPRDFEVLTPFHRVSGDLGAGVVRQQLRRARGGVSPPLRHTGNLLEFRIGRHRSCLDVEDAILAAGIERHPDRLVLWHESSFRAPSGWLRARETEAGRLRYAYEVAADTPLLRLTVTLTAATRLAGLRVTTALDALDEDGLAMAALRVRAGGAWRDVAAPAQAGLLDLAAGSPLEHLAIAPAEAGLPVLHLGPGSPAGVMSAKAVAARGGVLHWLLLRHGPRSLGAGESLVVRETRLLADGTSAEAAAAAMAAPLPGLDLDPAPPPGAALHAAATALMFAATGAWQKPLAPARRQALEGWLAQALPQAVAAPATLADLAEAVLAARAWRRAGSAAAASPLAGGLAALIALQDGGGLFREPDGQPGTLLGHALALRALAQAAALAEAPGAAEAVLRGLGALSSGGAGAASAGAGAPAEGIVLAGAAPLPPLEEAEALAQVARAATVVALAAAAGRLPPEAEAPARALHRAAIAALRPLIRAREGRLEVLPAAAAGGVSPAAQAAATLALMAPEAVLPGPGMASRLPA